MSLLNLLDLDLCTGAQLDLIGEIVVLSRYDARVMVEQSYEGEVLDDDLYRKLIKWKILLNTNDCTYWSIMKGIKMFWDKTPVYYRTDPEIPATIILSTPPLDPSTNRGAAGNASHSARRRGPGSSRPPRRTRPWRMWCGSPGPCSRASSPLSSRRSR